MTILVVDDEPEYRLVLKNVLMSEGYNVIVAENGEDGFTKLGTQPIELVISDIYLPVLDGIRFHRKVRSTPELATVPFLFVSAFDDQHTLDAVQNPRTEGFLRKARPVSELKEWIQYLTTPEDKRPKMPPGSARSRLNDQFRRPR